MRILQVMASNKHGGAENFFSRLCVALAGTDIGQQVVIRKNAPCKADLLAGGITPVELPFLYSGDFLTKALLRRRIERFQPQIVLTWMSRATSTCPSGAFVKVARLGGYYDLKYYADCDHLIGNTRHIVQYLVEKGWPAERASYLPNFVDEAPSSPVSRASLDTPDDSTVFLALGRLHSDKAFDVLLDAMAKLERGHLWLAGEGPLDGALRAQAARLGITQRVHFLGWRTDSGALLEAADCLVCPSRVEPLGNVILEAWIHQKPVVAASSTGPQGLIETEKTGLLVPLEDAGGLAAAMARIMADRPLSDRLGLAGKNDYEAKFSRQAVVGRYLDFFEKVAG